MLTKEEITKLFNNTRPFTYQAFARNIERAILDKVAHESGAEQPSALTVPVPCASCETPRACEYEGSCRKVSVSMKPVPVKKGP